MDLKNISDTQKSEYNKKVSHIMQSFEWGEFRKSLGTKLLRFGFFKDNKLETAFQLTFHKIPFLPSNVGYLPKGPFPDKDLAKALTQIGKEQNCAFIKIEPNVLIDNCQLKVEKSFQPSSKPMFTKFNFVLDLTKSEDELLQNMHPKFRYNIRVAQKHGVKVEERTDDKAFEIYLKLYFETTKRQNYHGHTPYYHRKAWLALKEAGMARLLVATYKGKPLNAWMMFNFGDTLYYPYGGSSTEDKNVMAPNLTAWEAVKLGKKLGLKKLDLWGATDPGKGAGDPYFGFTRFKEGLGAKLVENIGTFDLVLNPLIYYPFTLIDRLAPLKFFLLKFF